MERKAIRKPTVNLRARAPVPMLVMALACLGAGVSSAQPADENAAAALRAKYGVLRQQLANNQFQRPLYLESGEPPGGVTGDIHALIQSSFTTVSSALNNAGNWCDIMMLHLNTKYCRVSVVNQREVLNVSVGKKHDQALDDAHRVVFAYHVAAQTASYLRVQLNADEGPLSTRDYRIVLEAIPLDSGQTFTRLSYSYSYGLAGRLAMQAYLGTIGRNKVGFTVTGKQSSGESLHIGGMRGVVERNTMRYYLAIEAFLGALSAPPQARREKSMRDWFAAIERHPRQLHELELNEYLDMKRKEFLRLQVAAPLQAPG